MALPVNHVVEEGTVGGLPGGRLKLSSLGEWEVASARKPLFELAARHSGVGLALDLGGLGYLSSAGLGLFLTLNKKVKATGGRLSLHNVSEQVYELFAVTRLTSVLDVRARETDGNGPIAASA